MSKIVNHIPAKIWGSSHWSRSAMLGSAERGKVWLIFMKLFSKNSNACDHSPVHQRHRHMDRQTDRQRDGRTTYHGITVLRYASRSKKWYRIFWLTDVIVIKNPIIIHYNWYLLLYYNLPGQPACLTTRRRFAWTCRPVAPVAPVAPGWPISPTRPGSPGTPGGPVSPSIPVNTPGYVLVVHINAESVHHSLTGRASGGNTKSVRVHQQ